MTFQQVKDSLRAVDMVVRRTPDGEYRVNFPMGSERTAYYTNDAQDAINTGIMMRQQIGTLGSKVS